MVQERKSRDRIPLDITAYPVLSFLTPMFGVLCGAAFLDQPLSGAFAFAALLVAAGIVLVNLRK